MWSSRINMLGPLLIKQCALKIKAIDELCAETSPKEGK